MNRYTAFLIHSQCILLYFVNKQTNNHDDVTHLLITMKCTYISCVIVCNLSSLELDFIREEKKKQIDNLKNINSHLRGHLAGLQLKKARWVTYVFSKTNFENFYFFDIMLTFVCNYISFPPSLSLSLSLFQSYRIICNEFEHFSSRGALSPPISTVVATTKEALEKRKQVRVSNENKTRSYIHIFIGISFR